MNKEIETNKNTNIEKDEKEKKRKETIRGPGGC